MRVVTLEEYEREGEEARRVQEAEAKERKETRKVAKRAPKPVVPTMRAEEEAEEEPSDDVVAVGVEEENVLRKPFTSAPSSDREAKSWPSATASFFRSSADGCPNRSAADGGPDPETDPSPPKACLNRSKLTSWVLTAGV